MKCFSWLFSVFLALLVATSPSHAQTDPPFASPGVWTLHDLGYEDIYMPADGGTAIPTLSNIPMRFASPVVKYTLPSAIAEKNGPDVWYILHYHFEVELDPLTPDGKLTVLANTNGPMASAMIRFYVSHEPGAPFLYWKSLGMTDGWQDGTTNSNKVEIRFSNYMGDAGVKRGDNFLLFAVKEEGGIKTSMFHVFDDTSIEVTALAPPSLSIDAEAWHPPVGQGDVFDVDYTIKNTGGWPAQNVIAEVSYPDGGLQLLGDSTTEMPPISGSASQQGKFTFKVLSPGTYNIRIDADSGNGGHAAVELIATIGPDFEDRISKTRFWLLLALIFALTTLPLLPYGRLLRLLRTHH